MNNTIRTTLLLGALTGLLLAFGSVFGGRSGMVFAFGFAVIMNMGAYWYSDKIVLKLYKAQPVTEAQDPSLIRMVRELSTRAGLHKHCFGRADDSQCKILIHRLRRHFA